MPLVDYDASDDDESEEEEEREEAKGFGNDAAEEEEKDRVESFAPAPSPLPSYPPPDRQNQILSTSSHQHPNANNLSPPSLQELPNVSDLLGSTPFHSQQMVGADHSSRVAAAVIENSSRKREANGSAFPQTSAKHSRGEPQHLRAVPNTMDGLLVPPQLRGRSNVVTEDIGKLFVSKHTEPSS